jgi:hypothetical protein
MNALLTILLAVNLALAGADTPLRERGRKALVGPPLRVGSYAALRGGVTTAGGVEINTQIVGSNRLGLDLGVAASTLRRVDNFQPLRQFASLSLVIDGVFALTPGINIGPTASVSFRPYQQQWAFVDGTWTPTLGLRLTTGILTSRTWQMHLTLRGTTDLTRTRLVFATSEVRELNPMELQVGLRFLFARQRSPLVLQERRD